MTFQLIFKCFEKFCTKTNISWYFAKLLTLGTIYIGLKQKIPIFDHSPLVRVGVNNKYLKI